MLAKYKRINSLQWGIWRRWYQPSRFGPSQRKHTRTWTLNGDDRPLERLRSAIISTALGPKQIGEVSSSKFGTGNSFSKTFRWFRICVGGTVSFCLNVLISQLIHPLSILCRRPAIIDGELGTDRAKDLVICCWGHLGHYAVDELTLGHHAEIDDVVSLHSTLLEHQHESSYNQKRFAALWQADFQIIFLYLNVVTPVLRIQKTLGPQGYVLS